jgi:hypothetical protein
MARPSRGERSLPAMRSLSRGAEIFFKKALASCGVLVYCCFAIVAKDFSALPELLSRSFVSGDQHECTGAKIDPFPRGNGYVG